MGLQFFLAPADSSAFYFTYKVDPLTIGNFCLDPYDNGVLLWRNFVPLAVLPEDISMRGQVFEWCLGETPKLLAGRFLVSEDVIFIEKAGLVFKDGLSCNSIKDSFQMLMGLTSLYRQRIYHDFGCPPRVDLGILN